MNTINSITVNGISICPTGEENYTTFYLQPRLRTRGKRWQYDYRDSIDNELFSCIGHSLEHCREKRDEWLKKKYTSIQNCKYYIPANGSDCAMCQFRGDCIVRCGNFKYQQK